MELTKAFPCILKEDVQLVLAMLQVRNKEQACFHVTIQGEVCLIPERVYFIELPEVQYELLTPRQQLLTSCLFTRHHDGFVRQRHVTRILQTEEAWVLPYVIRLLGEYVVEILYVIKKHLHQIDRAILLQFIKENQAFYSLQKARVASYWNGYYRGDFPKKTDYVGFQMIGYIEVGSAC
ncbi:MAG: hypothetical protein ABS949_08255 [Solibacillus sp.]